MPVFFHKLHGLGNDFVLIDARKKRVQLSRKQIQILGSRTEGVGFDQLLVLERISKAVDRTRLIIYNTDGSRAKMCGNGLRAAALYLWKHAKPKHSGEIQFLTDSGPRAAKQFKSGLIEGDLGTPRFLGEIKKKINSTKQVSIIGVDAGNRHAVVFYYPKTREELIALGSQIEKSTPFGKRVNVQFIRQRKQKGRDSSFSSAIDILVWEAGVGITRACGTGAVAAVVAAKKVFKKDMFSTPAKVQVFFPGGNAAVVLNRSGTATLIGRATYVFRGEIEI